MVHSKAWRGRQGGRPGGRRHSAYTAGGDAAAGVPPLRRRAPAQLLLLALLGLAVLYRAVSHLFVAPQPELADLLRLDGDGPGAQQAAAAAASGVAAATQPKLIPRILHQTYPGSGLPPAEMRRWMASWRVLNPGWEVRLYTDQVGGAAGCCDVGAAPRPNEGPGAAEALLVQPSEHFCAQVQQLQ